MCLQFTTNSSLITQPKQLSERSGVSALGKSQGVMLVLFLKLSFKLTIQVSCDEWG